MNNSKFCHCEAHLEFYRRCFNMASLLDKVEEGLHIPKEKIIEYGVKRFLLDELRNLTIEIRNISIKYGINSFDELWYKIEKSEITEEECFNDLIKLEYLELRKEQITILIKEYGPLNHENAG